MKPIRYKNKEGQIVEVDYQNEMFSLPDMDYFGKYPAPMFEAMFNLHFGPINTTTTYYGPLLYWLARCIGAVNIMEIGMSFGWSSYFLAAAATDEGNRVGQQGMYYGVDIGDGSDMVRRMQDRGLNAKFIHKDSLKLEPKDFDHRTMHLIFQDGWHSTEYVMDELALLRPHLHEKGLGYWVMHDVYSWCEEAFPKVVALGDWEYVRFLVNYGLGIFRNMKNYDYNHIHWPTGPQKPAYPNKEEIVH